MIWCMLYMIPLLTGLFSQSFVESYLFQTVEIQNDLFSLYCCGIVFKIDNRFYCSKFLQSDLLWVEFLCVIQHLKLFNGIFVFFLEWFRYDSSKTFQEVCIFIYWLKRQCTIVFFSSILPLVCSKVQNFSVVNRGFKVPCYDSGYFFSYCAVDNTFSLFLSFFILSL